ncbi:MAG TPA: hypothetical protein VN704_11160, partial [Verrucomicrobiae bacterium]|nr:hypothetical protein [Verrucomicrobiae bacterium]
MEITKDESKSEFYQNTCMICHAKTHQNGLSFPISVDNEIWVCHLCSDKISSDKEKYNPTTLTFIKGRFHRLDVMGEEIRYRSYKKGSAITEHYIIKLRKIYRKLRKDQKLDVRKTLSKMWSYYDVCEVNKIYIVYEILDSVFALFHYDHEELDVKSLISLLSSFANSDELFSEHLSYVENSNLIFEIFKGMCSAGHNFIDDSEFKLYGVKIAVLAHKLYEKNISLLTTEMIEDCITKYVN